MWWNASSTAASDTGASPADRTGSPRTTLPSSSAPPFGFGDALMGPRPKSIRDPAHRADFGKFARQLLPAVAGVLGRVELAVMAAGDDALGVGRVRRERPDRRIRLDRQGQHLPFVAAVARAVDAAGTTDRAVAAGDEERLRVVDLLGQRAAIGQLEAAVDAERDPAVAGVAGGENLARRRGQHLDPAVHVDGHVVDVG